MSEQNKALAHRFFEECVNRKNIGLMYELFQEPFDIRDGTVHASEKPGLGFTLRDDALERFKYIPGPQYVF